MNSEHKDELKNEENKVYCRRCGRLLVGMSSKELGFGPTCYKAWKKEHSKQIQLFDIDTGDDSKDGRLQ